MNTYIVHVKHTHPGKQVEEVRCVVLAADMENVLIKVKSEPDFKVMNDSGAPEIVSIRKLKTGVHWL